MKYDLGHDQAGQTLLGILETSSAKCIIYFFENVTSNITALNLKDLCDDQNV